MSELIFEVSDSGDGGYTAECLTEAIVCQADDWQQLREEVQDAVRGHFFDRTLPTRVRLHWVRDEVLHVA